MRPVAALRGGEFIPVATGNPESVRLCNALLALHATLPAHGPQPTACVAQENGVGKRQAGLGAKACKALASKGDHDPPPPPPAIGDCSRKELKGKPEGRVGRGRRGIAPSQYSSVKTALKLALAVPLITLIACAHQPLTRSCLTQQQYEQLKASEPPKVHDKLTGDADKDTRPLAGSALELRSWGHAMLGTLKICSESP